MSFSEDRPLTLSRLSYLSILSELCAQTVERARLYEAEKKTRKVTSTGVAQFRNPADATQTWTGRGRKPQWLLDWVAAGNSLDALRV